MDSPQLTQSDSLGYSSIAIDHFRNPRNVGKLDAPNAIGQVDDRETENLITIYLELRKGRLSQVTFRALGCSSCIAASSILTVLATGRTPTQARSLTGDHLLSALGGLPEGKHHCAHLAAQALANALAALAGGVPPGPVRGA